MLLAVTDTGTGMDAETQKRDLRALLHDQRGGRGAPASASPPFTASCTRAAASIDVYSEPGRGTTFKVYLPRFAGDAAVPRHGSGLHPALPTGSETVLVVEDEAAIRQI